MLTSNSELKHGAKTGVFILLGFMLPGVLFPPSIHAAPPGAETVPKKIAPINAPFEMPDLKRPEFPDRTFNVRNFGAVKIGENEIKEFDFKQDERIEQTTDAINNAIWTASNKGGGTVRIPGGHWVTGPIHLRSNVNLHIAEDAVVHFSEDISDYLPVVRVRYPGLQAYNYSPLIYARNVKNVAVTGNGTLDGHNEHWQKWWRQSWKETGKRHSHGYRKHRVELAETPLSRRMIGKGAGIEGMRPCFMTFFEASNILVEGVTVKDGPTWNIHPVYSENVIVRGVTIKNEIPNGDGVNPDSCRNVLVEHCTFKTRDDAVSIKSGLNEAGLRVDRPSENIVVRKYIAGGAHRHRVTIGSEMSGGVRNVYIHDGIHRGSGSPHRSLVFKSAAGRGNVVEHIYIEDLKLKGGIQFFNTSYGGRSEGPVPLYREFHIRSVEMKKGRYAVKATAHPRKWFQNFTIRNTRFNDVKSGVLIRRLNGLKMKNVIINCREGKAIVLNNVTDASLKNLMLNGPEQKIHLQGKKSSSITLHGLTRNQVSLHKSLRDGTIEVDGKTLP